MQDRIYALMERLDRPEREIQALREEVKDLRAKAAPEPAHPEYRREDGEDVLTEYANPAIRLDVSGQVHPAMNVAGDGVDTKVYFVDNDATASRVRLAGVGRFSKLLSYNEKNAPLRRNVSAEEVGNVAAFLLADLARGVTGEITYVDNGFSTVAAGLNDD